MHDRSGLHILKYPHSGFLCPKKPMCCRSHVEIGSSTNTPCTSMPRIILKYTIQRNWALLWPNLQVLHCIKLFLHQFHHKFTFTLFFSTGCSANYRTVILAYISVFSTRKWWWLAIEAHTQWARVHSSLCCRIWSTRWWVSSLFTCLLVKKNDYQYHYWSLDTSILDTWLNGYYVNMLQFWSKRREYSEFDTTARHFQNSEPPKIARFWFPLPIKS
jgi:hypothetical protein